jgi:hypothetical protein
VTVLHGGYVSQITFTKDSDRGFTKDSDTKWVLQHLLRQKIGAPDMFQFTPMDMGL